MERRMSDEAQETTTDAEEATETGVSLEGDTFPIGVFITTENGDIYRQATPGSGFYGSGANRGSGNHNHARWTTPGFQKDKWERGPLMPR